MTFHEGQEVEVWGANMYPWRKAKIIAWSHLSRMLQTYEVQFPDGARGVFDAEHIRAVDKYAFAGAIQRARSANQIP